MAHLLPCLGSNAAQIRRLQMPPLVCSTTKDASLLWVQSTLYLGGILRPCPPVEVPPIVHPQALVLVPQTHCLSPCQ